MKTKRTSYTSKSSKRKVPQKNSRPPKSTRKRATSKAAASSVKKKSKKIRAPRSSKQYLALPDAQQETWNRAVHVIAKMRSEGKSLTQASRDFGVDPRVVRARAGSALRKTKSGRYVARPSDKLLRILVIPSPEGLKEIPVRGSAIASKLAEYSDAVQKYLRTGDSSPLKKFRRLKLIDEKGERIRLLTDLAKLQELGSAGVLSFESLYRSAA